jgi:hypothetical protein
LSKCCKFIYWANATRGSRLYGLKQWHRRTGGLWNPSLAERDLLFGAILG